MSDGSHTFNLVVHELKYKDRRLFHAANVDPSRTTVKKIV